MRIPNSFLDINTPRRFQGRNKILFGHRDSHSFTTSATNGFDHHRKTDSLSLRHQSRVVLRLPVISLCSTMRKTTHKWPTKRHKDGIESDEKEIKEFNQRVAYSPTCMQGTPAAVIMALEVDLMPMSRIASEGGPTKMTPLSAQASANSVFSERKP